MESIPWKEIEEWLATTTIPTDTTPNDTDTTPTPTTDTEDTEDTTFIKGYQLIRDRKNRYDLEAITCKKERNYVFDWENAVYLQNIPFESTMKEILREERDLYRKERGLELDTVSESERGSESESELEIELETYYKHRVHCIIGYIRDMDPLLCEKCENYIYKTDQYKYPSGVISCIKCYALNG